MVFSTLVGLLYARAASVLRASRAVLPDAENLEPRVLAPSVWPAGRRRILLIEDDPALRLLLRTTLAADEYAIEEAASAEEAAGIARFWKPALVVLDVGLPGIGGLEFAKELNTAAQNV